MVDKMNHGDFRQFATDGMYRQIEKIINAKSSRRKPYYILVIVKPYYMGPAGVSKIENGVGVQNPTKEMNVKGCVSHTRIIIIEPEDIMRHAQQLGTICWRIDNRLGKAEMKWALPFDKPHTVEDSEGEISSRAAESARKFGVPLFYG